MRWEELWDISEKIKHMFIRTPFPGEMEKELEEGLASYFGGKAVAVRSSAPGEDSAKTSFAGVHASIYKYPWSQGYPSASPPCLGFPLVGCGSSVSKRNGA